MGEFSAQGISMLAWAFATLGHFDKKLFAALALETQLRVSEFNAQDLANTAWAFATVGQLDEQLFAALALEVLRPSACGALRTPGGPKKG